MKIRNLILLAVIPFTACMKGEPDHPVTENLKQVEIAISTSGQRTRTTVGYSENESIIEQLDLLVFGANGRYLYSREATKLSTGLDTYRAMLVETTEELTIHLIANCRAIIQQWEIGGDKTSMNWKEVHAELIDANPSRLAKGGPQRPLPMWGTVSGKLADENYPTRLGPVKMLRSVASVDLYVEKNDRTGDFTLTDLYLYYAPDKGFVGSIKKEETMPQQYLIPQEMGTTLNGVLHATETAIYRIDDKQYDGIAYQMYLYDNDAVSKADEGRRPTRVIIAGYYKQTGDESKWVKSYYPIDLVMADGTYRPVIRNCKYELKVYAVNGPGQNTLKEAAVAAQSDLNLKIIEWNRDDVEIGVRGKYYVSIERRAATLWREMGTTDQINLIYRIEDDDPADFKISFSDSYNNGKQQDNEDGIQNDYFRVISHKTPSTSGGTMAFTVEALHDYTAGHDRDYLEIVFRELRFGFSITQLDSSENDWKNGGEIPANL